MPRFFTCAGLLLLMIQWSLGTATSLAQISGFDFAAFNQRDQYAGQPISITLFAVDANGHTVTDFSGSVELLQFTSEGIGRIQPSSVTMSDGTWSGDVTVYRADVSAITRGSVNIYAFLAADMAINGSSNPFVVYPGALARLQIVVPGQTPEPGSIIGVAGSPASQAIDEPFTVDIYSTDSWWNPVPSDDTVRITSNDTNASTPMSGLLIDGHNQFTLSLGTEGTRTLTVADESNDSIQSMTSMGITVLPATPIQEKTWSEVKRSYRYE